MDNETGPVSVYEPDECSQALVDKFYLAILRGKLKTTRKFIDGGGASVEMKNRSGQTPLFFAAYYGHISIVKLLLEVGADPNSRCTYSCCTPVHAACWSGNSSLLKMLLLAGGNLWLHDREGRAPRDWAALQTNEKKRLGILSLITTFNQMAASSKIKSAGTAGTLLREEILGPQPSEIQGTFRLPATLLRNTLAVFGMTCKGNCKDVGPLGQTRGNGFGQVMYGQEECAAAFLPVPLVSETELGDDPEDESCLDQLLPNGVSFRCGSTTEMVPRRWQRTPVTIRRMKGNQPADLLIEELRNMRNLSHPCILYLLAVCTTQQAESMQLIFEPIFEGSFHSRLHRHSESPLSLSKRLIFLQHVCEAVLYLHSKNLLHCSISSHAVHLTSNSQAKLGCFETLSESPLTSANSRAMHRKVPSSHWDFKMKWMSPELVRGEPLTALSDAYSFCCLVWEACLEKEPWSGMTPKSISQMWFNNQEMCHGPCVLPLNGSIPPYLVSLLELGLQPDIDQRRDFNLKWILRALRTKQEFNYNVQSNQLSRESNSATESVCTRRRISPQKPTRFKTS